jgi:glycogen phosphorylase/synthase
VFLVKQRDHNNAGYLFEVSWEVCNKVGGIYTVIASKSSEAARIYGDRYILLGPDLKTNPDFEETDEASWAKVREATAIKEIPCRFGRWRIPGNPKVILVNFGKKYDKDQLLFSIWEDYGVDSIAGGWDYVEPVMFSYACGEVIGTIYNLLIQTKGIPAVAQFHEWMCGAGLLYLKKKVPAIGTVFTTHATILGRSLAGAGMDIYKNIDHISPHGEASAHNINAKYSMEVVAARESDCFTTVSGITAGEAKNLLGRAPDVITPNGLDPDHIPDLVKNRKPALKSKEKLLEAASLFLGKDFPTSTKIMAISGRYEFHNKGIDIFLDVLGRLDKEVPENPPVLVFLLILGGHTDLIPALQCDCPRQPDPGNIPIATYRLQYEASDPILQACNRLGLKNAPQNRVNIIFIPAYLNGHDGLVNMTYYEALSGCDLGVFPSYYEPWGYTPLESIAHAVPTITTDQAGFGVWVQESVGESNGVILLKSKGRKNADVEDDLYGICRNFISWTDKELQERREDARFVALKANWKDFFEFYLQAYEKALAVAHDRAERLASIHYTLEEKHTFAGTVSSQPHFRLFTAVANLPAKIGRLRELAYNLWWTWHPHARSLYIALDPKIWPEMGNNPVKMLESVSSERLMEAAENSSYLNMYSQIIQQFDDYMSEKTPNDGTQVSPVIKWSSPIAYFSTEYGLHESIPIYSGGLGTLAGDHLKTASDIGMPLVGVGLLYKNGYFRQIIDNNGIQIADYPENNFSLMPVEIVRDDAGNEVQVSIELPGRTLFASIWQVKVGRVSLYLLNTDVPRNTIQDRKITDRLYPAEQRIRIEQEILLGMGGIRLLNKLGIRPSVYHINEGHSAFLILERLSNLMTGESLSLDEAMEVVCGSTVFTTHTPVEAGNERFPRDLMEYYFSGFVKRTGMSWSQFWELGRKETGEEKPFFMTVLAFKMSHLSNAVSQVHEEVSRRLWRDVWKGFNVSDVPIGHITNGAHTLSYIAPRMKSLFDTYLGSDWERNADDPEIWERIQDIPDALLWDTRYELKQETINFLREYIARHWAKYGFSKTWREEFFSKINPSSLIIGFARRFAPYKRADLILSDLARLEKILNHPGRPVHILFAGKSHPNDEMGKNLIKKVVDICKDERFRGKIFFIEDYDFRVARHLLHGTDVWLNTPRRPYEASGTSGEKVVANGVLNLSIADGWWCEGYDGTNGWTIGPVIKGFSEEIESTDEEDAQSLYSLLENTVIPTFYSREISGLPEKWISMIKRAMQTLMPRFNTRRMLLQYYNEMYLPAANRDHELNKNTYGMARDLADWKRKIPMRFSSLKLLDISIKGIYGDTILINQPLQVNARIDPGKMEADEILVELIVGRKDGYDFEGTPACIPLKVTDRDSDGILTFSAEYIVKQNGPYCYGVRVIPYHRNLTSKQETGLILWA